MSPKGPKKPVSKAKPAAQVRTIPTKVLRKEVVESEPEDAEPGDDWEPGEPPENTDDESAEPSGNFPVAVESHDPEPDHEAVADDHAVSPVSISDPLRKYMEEIRRYPLLPPEEEMKLAIKLRETGDIGAAKALVQANLRLVVKIAFEYRSIYSNMLDLIQEGNIGLMKAVSKYDPTKGARLGYYSSWWVRSYILKYLIDNFRLVKIGTTQAQKKLFYHLMREKERIEAQGIFAAPKLLADRLDVREKDVVEMEQRLSGHGAEVPIDAPIRGGEESANLTPAGLLADSRPMADDLLAHSELLKLLSDRLPLFKKSLKDKELKILEDRLLSEEPRTLQDVADQYGLTRERVRQIETKVIQKLREFLKPSLAGRRKPRGP